MRQLVPHYTGSILTTSVLAINTVAPHLLNRRSREWLSASVLSICSFVCLSPKCKKTQFSLKLSNLELWCLLTTYSIGSYVIGLFKEPIIRSLKSKMADIRHLENRHDVFFFCRGWSDLDKISETGAEWHVDCNNVVEIETRCRIPIWRTFGRIQWHVIPEPPATLQGAATGQIQQHVISEPRITLQSAATWWIHCHDSRATCHIAECNGEINVMIVPHCRV